MFGIGIGEFMIIAIVLLIVVGPQKLPDMMKTVAKGVRQVRHAADELRDTIGIDELLREPLDSAPLTLTPSMGSEPIVEQEISSISVEIPTEGVALPPLEAQPTMQVSMSEIQTSESATPLEAEATQHWTPDGPQPHGHTTLNTQDGLSDKQREKKLVFPPPASGTPRVSQNPLQTSKLPPKSSQNSE